MATAAVLTPHDVPTTLNYYAPTDGAAESPYSYVQAPPEGKPRTNVGTDPRPVVVHDARGREHELTLDTAGFQFVKYPSAESKFDDEERIKTEYYKEIEELLKTVAGAKCVFIFDHTIRCVLFAQLEAPCRAVADSNYLQAPHTRRWWGRHPREPWSSRKCPLQRPKYQH